MQTPAEPLTNGELAAGAIWGAAGDEVSEATRYGQEALTLLGAIIAFVGRLRARRPATILPD